MIECALDTAAKVQRVFPYAKSESIRTHLPLIVKALNDAGIGTRDMLLMALGTIAAETSSFRPIDEGRSRFNTDPGGRPFARYDLRHDIGNGAPGDGARYKGRGFIQLTGKFNYERFGRQLGVDLVEKPELANDPAIAARILAAFLKAQEARITNALKAYRECVLDGDAEGVASVLKQARRLVNGGSHGLKDFSAAFRLLDLTLPK